MDEKIEQVRKVALRNHHRIVACFNSGNLLLLLPSSVKNRRQTKLLISFSFDEAFLFNLEKSQKIPLC